PLGVRTLLYLAITALCAIGAGLGVLGLNGMGRSLDGLNAVYQDRVIPLRDLKVISDQYSVSVVDAVQKVRDWALTPEQAAERLRTAQRLIHEHWSQFRATSMTATELELVTKVEPLIAQGEELIDRMAGSLESGVT